MRKVQSRDGKYLENSMYEKHAYFHKAKVHHKIRNSMQREINKNYMGKDFHILHVMVNGKKI